MADLPVAAFPTAADWEGWLADHHATSPGVWLKIAKKGAAAATVSYAQALDGALCYGWIDGQKGALDDAHWRQRFTPRRPGSRWSQANCARAEALLAAGRMRPAGLREVEQAKADGRWEAAYAGQRAAEVPDDLRQALAANPAAQAFFATLDRANRYAILYRVQDARKPETRAARITRFVAMCAEGRWVHP
jgi:uncharacterized protein YdeI (YjbR/CyaY-like superfamily)